MIVRPLLLIALALAASACEKPDQATGVTSAPVTACTKPNDQCVYSPGKLGLCTASSMACDGGGECLVCMSLH